MGRTLIELREDIREPREDIRQLRLSADAQAVVLGDFIEGTRRRLGDIGGGLRVVR